MTNDEVARAFSGHRFEDALGHLASDVVWNLIGAIRLEGRDAVADACRETMVDNVNVTATWLRFISTGDGDVVAVDAIGSYSGSDGVSTVSSCDIFEFDAGSIRTITSYTVEVDPDRDFLAPA